MTRKEITFITNCVLILACSFMLGLIVGREHPQKSPTDPIKGKVDTLIIRDTIAQIQPVYIEKRVVDKQLVKITDTLSIHDTLYVYLDREQVVWQDSLSVVYASGILPQVDSVRHFQESRIITIEKTIPVKIRSRWGLGVQAGMGACKDGLTPYVGVGVSYNILSW